MDIGAAIVNWLGTAGAAATASTAATAATATTFWGSVAAAAINVTLLTVASSAFAPKPGQNRSITPKQSLSGRTVNSRVAIGYRQYVYGQVRVGGQQIFIETTGTDNKYLHFIIVHAAHECEEVGDLYINDEIVPLTGHAPAVGSKYRGFLTVYTYTGSPTQTHNTQLASDTPLKWTDEHDLRGIAYTYCRLSIDTENNVWPGGIPSISRVIKGRKVYDPRTDSTAYSANSALCTADFLASEFGYGRYGLTVTDSDTTSDIDVTSLEAAANVCDEQITLDDNQWITGTDVSIGTKRTSDTTPVKLYVATTDGTTGVTAPTGTGDDIDDGGVTWNYDSDFTNTESRYRTNGTVRSSDTPMSVVKKLKSSMAGFVEYIGDKWFIHAGAYRAPSITLSEGDFRGGINGQTQDDRRTNTNRVRGVFSNAGNDFNVVEFPAVTNSTYLTEDRGIEAWREVDFAFTTSAATAQRLAKIQLERARQQITHTARFSMKAMQIQPGDTFNLTFAKYGYSSKAFSCTSHKLVLDSGALVCEMSFRETSSAVYTWANGEETVLDPAPNSNLPNPFSIAAPTNLTAASGTAQLVTVGDVVQSRIRFNFDVAAEANVQSHEIKWRKRENYSISAITKANPAVLTTTAEHTLEDGDIVVIWNVTGMTEIIGIPYIVANSNPALKTVELSNCNSTSFTTYSGPTGWIELDWESSVTIAAPSSQFLISDVEDGYAYDIEVRAINALTKSDWVVLAPHTVIGKTAAPADPVAPTVSAVANGVSVQFGEHPDLDFLQYQIWVQESSTAPTHTGTGAFSPAPTTTTSDRSKTITGLDPDLTYYVFTAAKDSSRLLSEIVATTPATISPLSVSADSSLGTLATLHRVNLATTSNGGVTGVLPVANTVADANTINANDGLAALDGTASTKLGTIANGATDNGATIDTSGDVDAAIDFTASGAIKHGKTSSDDASNAGFWLGKDGQVTPNYDFHIGNSTNSLKWDGSDSSLTVKGDLTAGSVDIGTGFSRTEINSDGVSSWAAGRIQINASDSAFGDVGQKWLGSPIESIWIDCNTSVLPANLYFGNVSTGASNAFITGQGNAEFKTLDVTTSLDLNSSTLDASNGVGTAGQVLSSQGTYTQWINAPGGGSGTVTGTGTLDVITAWDTGGASLKDSALTQSIAAGASTMNFSSSSTASSSLIVENTNTGASSIADIRLQTINSAVEADAQILVNPAGYMNVKNIQGVSAIYTDFTTHVFRANSGASTFAKLTTAGLRLGDGATATAKLDVIGTGKFSSTVTAPTFIGALTGNAATATTASNASLLNSISAVNLFNNMGDVHSTRTAFDATTPTYGYGWRYVQGTTNGPATGGTQYYSQYVGLGSQYPATGAGSYGMQVAYSRNVANPYIAIRYNESNALGAWSKISAGKADTLTTARAINGVNFDGSAPITITANANLAGNLLTAVPSGAVFTDTNTTYSVGDGGLSQINFTSADHTKLNGIATSANNYVRPSSETQYIVTAGNSNGIGFWQNISAYAIQMGNNQANHGTVTDYSMHHNMGTNAGRGFTFGSSRTAVSASINALTGSANFNGSVGIGTAAAPGAKLEVYGGQLRINTADGLYARTEHAHAGTKVWSVGTQGNATDYQIYRESGAGNVIINSGNVGIGTTTPLFGLHHKGTSNAPSLSSAAGIAAFETSSSAELTMGGYTSSPYGFWLQTKDSGAGGVGSGSSYPLLLNPLGGNIGIGTTSATYKLVVDDDASSGKGLHVLGGGGGGTLARFERNVGSSGCLVDINCNSGDPQIRFTESSGVDWTMGVESNVFEIVDGNALSGTSRLEISTTGATFGGTVAASNLSGTNTGDQSAASILTAIKTVDGAGSGLDADTVDGISSASFLRSDTADTSSQRITFTACATNNWDTIATASGSQGGLEVQNSGAGNDAFMTFHAGADFALYFGLDADINDIAVGGWSMGANKYRIWHAGNDGSGSGLDADLLKGLASTTSNIVNTIPVRDGSGDIHARLLRQQYTGTTTTANYIMTQVSLGTGDNYLRACPMSSFRTTLYAGGIHVPGGGAVATNEAFGTGALASNTTGSGNTATGYQALYNETTASGLTAVGHKALEGNASAGHATQGTLNTGVGYEVLKDSATGYYNTGIGYQSLQHVDAGHSNIGVGVQALRFDSGGTTSGYQNIGVGFQTGFSLTTGYRNVMMGHLAGYAMTSAFENIAIGYDSGNDITDGYRNVTIGTSAGRLITTGDYNTIIGRAAGYDQTTASHNTAIGASAGANMTNGGNVFVGSGSGDGTTSGVNTAVGYQSLKTCTTGSLNTAIGYRAMDSLTTASNHTAVGTYAGLGSVPSSSAGNVWVGYDAGNGPVGSCTGIANVGIGHQCMTSHTAATAVTCVGYQAGLYLATANDSVGIGRNAMEGASTRLITGGSNVAVGPYAMRRAYTGVGNTSMGRSALHGQSATGTTGNYNVALGYEAGFDVSSGSYNVMTGYRAGNNITTGGTNTAIGTEAMYAATTAGSNVAVGRQALYALTDGLNNTAIGRNAADSTTSGDYNVAVGFQALDDNVTGSSKTAVGYQALQNDTGASLSTAVGYSALGGQTTGLYNVAIGHSAGGSVATNGDNVFVGTTTGIATTGSSNTMVGFQAGYDQTSGSNNLLLGRFAGRSSSPSGTITTGSNIVCLGDNSITALYCADTTISSSDARDKTDVEVFSAGLDFVKKLRPVTYRWDKRSKYLTEENDDLLSITPDGTHKESRQHLGFLAQEVEEIEKEFGYSQTKDSQLVVNTNEDDTAMGIKYERLVPVLVNAIKELSAEIENLKSQLNQS